MSRKMKDSGVEWIGEIPEELTIINTKYLLAYQKGKNPNTLNSENNGLPYIGASDLEKNGDIHSYSNYCEEDLPIAKKDDVLVLWDGARAGLIGTGHHGYIASTVSKITPRTELINKRFWWWYLKGMQPVLLDWVGGTTIPHMNRDFIYQLKIVGFKQDEQTKIASFLDSTVTQIDSIIERTKETINDYKSLKQSIITEAVTKGLNKDVEMKDSGIEWIGTIPNHWDVGKMKNYGKALIGLTYSPDNVTDKGKLVLRSSNVQNGKIDLNDSVFVDVKPKEHLLLKKNDILICARNGSKALVGKSALIPDELVGETFGAFMTVYRSIYNEFIYYVLNSSIFNYYIGAFSSSTINQLTTSTLNSIQLTIPPIEEQNHIVEYLRQRTGEIDRLIDYKIELLANLESYKKSLIYECVTGKREII